MAIYIEQWVTVRTQYILYSKESKEESQGLQGKYQVPQHGGTPVPTAMQPGAYILDVILKQTAFELHYIVVNHGL